MMSVLPLRTAVGAGMVTGGAGHVRLMLVTCETLAGRETYGRHGAMRCETGQDRWCWMTDLQGLSLMLIVR